MLGELVGGRYRLERELGRGGFGAVFVAVQEDLGRRVAVKMFHRRHLEGVGSDRFRREALLAQHLSHPNTVRLFDFGLHDGTPFIVFELLAGESLASLVSRTGPLPPARALHITAQILKSLMEAHDQGIVHRDVKPANVFICNYAGEQDFVKVLDFGIAKSVQQESTLLTATGEAVGTPSYMPPEQLSGGILGPATDLYAVGLIMAEMTSGTRVMSGSAMDVAVRQFDQQSLPFADAVRGSPLWPVIERATRKHAAQRFTGAGEMLAALEQLRGSTPGFEPGLATSAGSATVPIGALVQSQPYDPISSTIARPPDFSPAPAAPGRRAFSVIALLLLLFAGLIALAAVGAGAYFFLDLDSLLGQSARTTAPDGGTAPTTIAPGSDPGAAEASEGGASGPVLGAATARPTSTPTASATATPTSKSSGGATLGSACVSDGECKGAYEKCGPGGTCQCKTTGSFNAPRQCGSRCVANTDPDNCGACGKRCSNDEVCTTNMGGSVAQPICYECSKGAFGSPRMLCGPHQCVAPNTDPRNCGGCNKKCAPGQSCEGGVCK